MKRARSFLFPFLGMVLGVTGGLTFAGDFSGKSSSGKLAFSSKGTRQLYVWSTANPSVRVPVIPKGEFFETMVALLAIRGALISPDDQWLALECQGRDEPKTGSVLFLKRGKGLEFAVLPAQLLTDVKNPWSDPAPTATGMALKAWGITGDDLDVSDHADLHPLEWSSDSHWLVFSLNASGRANGKRVRISDAHFRFNPATQVTEAIPSRPGKVEIEGGR